jgi:hypothetical protein
MVCILSVVPEGFLIRESRRNGAGSESIIQKIRIQHQVDVVL